MKVLFLTESYYPKPSPNAICVAKLMQTLYKQGVNCNLITLKNIYKQRVFDIIDNIPVYRVNNFSGARLIYYCQTKGFKSNSPIWKFTSFFNKLHGALLGLWWPLLAPLAVLRYYNKAKKLHAEGHIDVVVGVYKQIEAVLAGVLLKKKHPDVQLIIYTLDAISGSILPVILHNKNIALISTKRWEKICFKYADSICVMNSHKEYYAQREYDKYRDKIKYMDIPLVDPDVKPDIQAIDTKNIRFVFTGSMHPTTANPDYFLRILEILSSMMNVSFHIYGNISPEIKHTLTTNRLFNTHIFIYGHVSHDEVHKIQKEANVLVNFGNLYPCTIPCKIFEYISLQKPILSFYKIDDDASKPYLDKYPEALLIKENECELIENSQRLKLFIETNLEQNNIKNVKDLYYTNTPYPMADEIKSHFYENK